MHSTASPASSSPGAGRCWHTARGAARVTAIGEPSISSCNGRTWDQPRRIAAVDGPVTRNPVAVERKQGRPDDVTYNNPIAIADRRTGAVHFVFCLEYGRAFYQRSDDDGISFSQPVEITSAFEAFHSRYNWRVIATGPGHGIQLANGRLLVPVWLSLGLTGNGHAPSAVSVIFSIVVTNSREMWARHRRLRLSAQSAPPPVPPPLGQ